MKKLLFALSWVVASSSVAAPPYESLPTVGNQKSATQAEQAPRSSAGQAPTAMWDLYSQVQQLQQEVQSLRGMVEELNHQVNQMRNGERQRYLDLDRRLNQLDPNNKGASLSPASGPASAKKFATDKAMYEQASELRKKNQFRAAIELLNDLLAEYPRGAYAPYSNYWLGELYLAVAPIDYKSAKKHFVSLLVDYPDHVKVPDAMYKLGRLYADQEQQDKARSTWNALIQKYPGKSAANLAKNALSSL